MNATLAIDTADAIPVARIVGAVDVTNAGRISTELLAVLPNTAIGMVLDLSETNYLDSKGIHLILGLVSRLASHGQQLALAVPDDSHVRRVLLITHLDEEVPLFHNTAEALACVNSASARHAGVDDSR